MSKKLIANLCYGLMLVIIVLMVAMLYQKAILIRTLSEIKPIEIIIDPASINSNYFGLYESFLTNKPIEIEEGTNIYNLHRMFEISREKELTVYESFIRGHTVLFAISTNNCFINYVVQ